jgi:adenosylcobinamide kinase / adenosylcobinamide-phosphate guanylyltransferase
MEVLLLGTGSVEGLPRPGCRCLTCNAGPARRPATAVLAGSVLLDPPADASGGAARLSTQVGAASPAADRPAHGAHLVVGDLKLQVRTLAAGTASGDPSPERVVLDVVASDGARLLWAPVSGPLPEVTVEALALTAFDTVLLDVSTGADPIGFAHQVARLRRVGAVTASTDVLAVGVGHDAPAAAELAGWLAVWGAHLPDDGARLVVGPGAARPGDPLPARTLLLGAAGSGKSWVAERLLAAEPEVVYLATGAPPDPAEDPEWARRVSAHRSRRPSWWHTVETDDVPAALSAAQAPVLLDSLGTWLTGALHRAGAWQDRPGWGDRLGAEVDALVEAWRQAPVTAVAVGEEVGWGVVPDTDSGRLFRAQLGALNQRLARQSEQALLVVAGRCVPLPAAGASFPGGVPAPGGSDR